jgi:purine nucleosidase
MPNLLLDLDTGVDDSIALALAAIDPSVNLVGVTATFGNVTTDVGARNTLDVLSLVGRTDVPVYEGAYHALNQKSFHPHAVSTRIHGTNGVGQVSFPKSFREIEKESAVDFIIRSMRSYGGDLTIITTGPSTNLATVLQREPELRSWQGKVVVMGGALTVRGNVNHFAEANISQDPEAAKMVFESGLDVTMVGLDVTMRIRLKQRNSDLWRSGGKQFGILFADMLEYYIANTLGIDETYAHDPSAVVCALNPEYFTIVPLHLTVETEGVDRGRTIVDHRRLREGNPTTKACIDVDAEKVEMTLEKIASFARS